MARATGVRFPAGPVPFGYRKGKTGYVLDKPKAGVVRACLERYLLYGSLRDAARYGSRKAGYPLTPSTVAAWLSHPVYRGDLVYTQNGRQIIHRDAHPALLSREEAAQIDRQRQQKKAPPRSAGTPQALAGLIRCGTCNQGLHLTTTRTRRRVYRYLRSPRCPRSPQCRAIPYEPTLSQVIAAVCANLAPTMLPKAQSLQARKQTLDDRLQTLQSLRSRLPQGLTQGFLDEETLALRQHNLDREIAALQTQLAALPPFDPARAIANLSQPDFWWGLSEVEQRTYLREFVAAVRWYDTGPVVDFRTP